MSASAAIRIAMTEIFRTRQTLEAWAESARVPVNVHESGNIYVVCQDRGAAVALFDLCDYLVSSVSGPTYWLVRRPAGLNDVNPADLSP